MMLPKDFYLRSDVVEIAKDLIGKVLVTKFNNEYSSGIITETEAYAGTTDKASHAYGGRRTKRTETMYAEGGCSYVYLCYGIHHLFNIVTNKKDIPHAVLIRGIKPLEGVNLMMKRRKKESLDTSFSSGPGTLSQALGISTEHNNISLLKNEIFVEDRGIKTDTKMLEVSKRIGIDYAEEDADLPYRFLLRETKLASALG